MNLLDPSWLEALRLFDALSATALVGVIFARTYRYWKHYDKQQKSIVLSYAGYLAAIAYTSFELYAQHATVGYRSYIVFVANAFAAYALLTNKKPGLMTTEEFEIKEYLEELDAKNDTTLR